MATPTRRSKRQEELREAKALAPTSPPPVPGTQSNVDFSPLVAGGIAGPLVQVTVDAVGAVSVTVVATETASSAAEAASPALRTLDFAAPATPITSSRRPVPLAARALTPGLVLRLQTPTRSTEPRLSIEVQHATQLIKLYVPLTPGEDHHTSIIWQLENPIEVNGKSKTHCCVVCFHKSSGKGLLKESKGKGGTFSGHAKQHQPFENGGFQLSKFTSLEEGKLRVCTTKTALDEHGKVVSTSTTKREMEELIAVYSADHGTMNTCLKPSFRNLLRGAQNCSRVSDLFTSPSTVANRLQEMDDAEFEIYKEEIANMLPGQRLFLSSDSWDKYHRKFLCTVGTWIVFVPGEPLVFRNVPLDFSQLPVDPSTGKVQTIPQQGVATEKALARVGATKLVVAGVKTDNAANKLREHIVKGNEQYKDVVLPESWAFDDEGKLIGCLCHVLALGIDDSRGKGRGVSSRKPPAWAKDCADLTHRVGLIVNYARTSSGFGLLESAGSDVGVTFRHFSADCATRWNGFDKQLEQIIRNKLALIRVLQAFEARSEPTKKKAKVAGAGQGEQSQAIEETEEGSTCIKLRMLTKPEFTLAQELHAIGRVLSLYVLGASQRSSKASVHTVLPLILFILHDFGVEVSNGLFVEKLESVDDEKLLQLKFDVLQPNGSFVETPLGAMCEGALAYFRVLQGHLIQRLHKERGNYFYHELLGMMLDHEFSYFAPMVLGSRFQGTKEWVIKEVARAASLVAPSDAEPAQQTALQPVVLDVFDDMPAYVESTASSVRNELDDLWTEPRLFVRKHLWKSRLPNLLALIEDYDPLVYWSKPASQYLFPGCFRINLTTLAYTPSTAFVESIFSVASSIFTVNRASLSAEQLRALVLHKMKAFISLRAARVETGWKGSDQNGPDTDDECAEGDDEGAEGTAAGGTAAGGEEEGSSGSAGEQHGEEEEEEQEEQHGGEEEDSTG